MTDRIAGYEAALREHDLVPDVWHSPGNCADRIGWAAARLRTASPPTAVVAYDGRMGHSILMAAALTLGLRVPEQLSIAVFAERLEDYAGMPFSTMQIPFYRVGSEAVSMLSRKIAEPLARCPAVALPLRLSPGATTAPPPGRSRKKSKISRRASASAKADNTSMTKE
jgi:DNA-binding LacI/PurR family transcriptional regulator